ncbi:class I adenylate-forming enzyme family protein [Aeromicrobium choanae]|uniref:Acyl-CoA synthetase (AMP-forming)/AMP-acid ligase II n=1 Tax=Aeromicrobium choanae TaxID=1736691 RepID=A0A1T4Z8G5_9ACTN|nr:AMP-binding protein [Aeromicrobium choanae]SKB09901.1 Acyl-CoA synthetase (AMP-forming)/AMP-acid ligase II [Aeromicrobium choanae]
MTLPYLADALAERFGAAPAVADDRLSLTFAELDARVDAVAGRLAQEGFGRGDVLAVMLPNRVELVVCLFAAWRLGGVATPVNPAFTQVEATHQVTDSGARLIVVESDDAPTGGARPVTVASLATATPTGAAPVELAPDDLALLVYTSGSTGRPKGVMLSHANVDAMSDTMARHMELDADDHCLLILPLFHVNAVMVSLLAPLRVGGRLTIVGRFSPPTFFDEVERIRPTYFSAVPTIYALLASLPDEVRPDTSSLRFVVCGAAPVSQELLTACERRFGFLMVEGYGLTEGTCASACNPVGPDAVRKLGTVGPALPGQRIAIGGPDGEHLPVGEVGEVLISGPTVMQGYLNQPQATVDTVVGGWLHTGDVGRLDEDGYLQLVDRIKDMIIRGGENLYPKEIENTIAGIEGVLEVAVVGRPDDVLGEVPVAFVVAYPGAVLTEDDVLAACRRELTRVKVPAAVDVIEALPKNPVGKIDKPTLRRLVRSA